MAVKKKLKISNTKRAQHLKNKKNFVKMKKPKQAGITSREPINKSTISKRIFGKSSSKTSSSLRKKCTQQNNTDSSAAPDTDGMSTITNNHIMENNDAELYDCVADMIDETDIDLYINHGKRKQNNYPQNNHIMESMKQHERDHVVERHFIQKNKKQRIDLLPIKNKMGELIERSMEIDKKELANKTSGKEHQLLDNDEKEEGTEEAILDSDDDVITDKNAVLTESNPMAISTADLLILRQQELDRQKYRIGILCSAILEKPEDKMKNFSVLFEMMDERIDGGNTNTNDSTINLLSVRQIATLSLMEIFKDILPEYRLGQVNLKTQTVRKNTMERVNYEDVLLQQYKKYLQRLEKITKVLNRKYQHQRHGQRYLETKKMATVAVICLCELLQAHPHFNFSQNIAQLLVYLLNANNPSIRLTIQRCFEAIFQEDRKFDLTLFIVRRINHVIKSFRSQNIHKEMLRCLLALQIKSVNLDAEKEQELQLKKLEAHRASLVNMSKKERKRKKRLQELDRELQETQAEENKQTKHNKLTEITKMVFTIYFRILKNDPGSTLLSVTLEGLAKFSHIINLDFFSDLIEVLNGLMNENGIDIDGQPLIMGYREQLHCIQTVFTILSGQGEVLNIDPLRFYGHFYRNMLRVNAGKCHDDVEIILQILIDVLLKRRNNLTQQRLMAFSKRTLTLSLYLMHHGTLSALSILKNLLQQKSSTADALLDTDRCTGSGRYNAELDDPEYCNAQSTIAYELATLARHYHPIVRKMVKHLAAGVPASGEGSLSSDIGKLNPMEIFQQYDSSQMAFNPAIPAPKPINFKEIKGRHFYVDTALENYCKSQLAHCINNNGDLLDFLK